MVKISEEETCLKVKEVENTAIFPVDAWKIMEFGFHPEFSMQSETIFSLGNGYIGMRGNLEEGLAGTGVPSVKGTYLNGFYESGPIHYPEPAYGYAKNSQTMLNVTDLKGLRLQVDGEVFGLYTGKLHRHYRELDMKRGTLLREIEWESDSGRRMEIRITRIVCLSRKHLAAVRYEVRPLNFSGTVTLISDMNGKVTNQVTMDDPRTGSPLSEQVLRTEHMEHEGTFACLRQRTKNTRFLLLSAVEHRLAPSPGGGMEPLVRVRDQSLAMEFEAEVTCGEVVVLEKYMSYFTSKDYPEEELLPLARKTLEAAAAAGVGFTELEAEQAEFLAGYWGHADVEIDGDAALQQGLRYNGYQLLQSAGRDGRTNVSAKGLSGEGYEGHYFWDTETFILPFFVYSKPEAARKLLEYRYSTLDQARERAAEMSQKGALYPWRTINGEETSAYYPAGTAQAHINADIIFGLKKYVRATGDEPFLLQMGAEMAAETARFWVSLGYYNSRRGNRFCIDGVTGPDEYTAVVNNNAYTNLMAKDNLMFAYETVRWMEAEFQEEYRSLCARIGLEEREPEEWRRAAENMFIPYDEQLGIVGQDDSFLLKRRWDFEGTPKENYPLLLNYHPLVIYRHQVLKQADVVLALLLQGDRFTLEEKKRNYDYYEPLTTHDSSLSPCIHSILAAELGYEEQASYYFNRTARMDLDDINHNVKDGIHTASMAGSWMAMVYGFAGMRDYGEMLTFKPMLPAAWNSYRFMVTYQGRQIEVHKSKDRTVYSLLVGDPIRLRHKEEDFELAGVCEFG